MKNLIVSMALCLIPSLAHSFTGAHLYKGITADQVDRFYYGYVSGVASMGSTFGDYEKCLKPYQLNAVEATKVVKRFIENYPQVLEWRADMVIMRALSEEAGTYPHNAKGQCQYQ